MLERGEVVIQWVDTVVGETGWRVQLSEDGQNWWHVNVPANEQTRVITGLEDGRKYWFRVRAFSDLAINPDGPNTAHTAKRSAGTLLPAPDQLVVTSPLAFTVHLSWRNNGGANVDQFVVQRSTNLVDWSDIVISGSATEFVDTGQDSGHTIFYRVFARNNLIQSAPTIIEQVIVA